MRKQLAAGGAVVGIMLSIGIIILINQPEPNNRLIMILTAILGMGILSFAWTGIVDFAIGLFSKKSLDWQETYWRLYPKGRRGNTWR